MTQTQPSSLAAVTLHAGPVAMKYQDGQLRYIHLGGSELVRRVYFAVRDKDFDTPVTRITRQDVQNRGDSFRIRLAAVSRGPACDYSWTAAIDGDANGRIVFAVEGAANSDFASPRIGINVLLGTAAVGGDKFTRFHGGTEVVKGGVKTILPDGQTEAEFPRLPGAASWDFGHWFKTIRYENAAGTAVQATFNGGYAGIEDQRNFGDSSYKVYGYMPYDYPAVPAHQPMAQQVTIEVIGPALAATGDEAITQVLIGGPMGDSKMPALLPAATAPKPRDFVAVNDSNRFAGSAVLAWRFSPAAHMDDDDTLMENISAVADQVATVRQWAPHAKIVVGPNSFNWHHPSRPRDGRNADAFAAAWCAAVWKYLALAAVDETAFDVGPGPCDAVVKALASQAERRLRHVDIRGPIPRVVEAFAVEEPAGGATPYTLYLVNLTDSEQIVTVRDIVATDASPARVTLRPYEVNQSSQYGGR